MTAHAMDRLVLGTAPDSWGIWFPQDAHQLPWPTFLDEVAEAGYSWLELGPYGYLPTEPARLADEVGKRGLAISGGTMVGALHRPHEWRQLLRRAHDVAGLTAGVGAHHLIFMPPVFRDEKTGEYTEWPTLDAAQWETLVRAANDLGKVVRSDHGLRLCLHSHADSHIHTQPQIERFLHDTDPEYVWLCLDTGHLAYGGGDAVDLIRRYPERIGYVHIKQMDRHVLEIVAHENLSFCEAVKRGVCVEPPAGDPDPASVIDALKGVDARVFVIVEQDLYPCEPDVPLPIAVRSRKYLASCGVDAGPQALRTLL